MSIIHCDHCGYIDTDYKEHQDGCPELDNHDCHLSAEDGCDCIN